MPGKKRRSPYLAPGYERIPGPLRHYRVLETGKEISRRQYQQRARGYVYEKVEKGRARARARRKWLDEWIAKIRDRFPDVASLSKTRILRELRRMGMIPPHHGKRKPSPAEAAKELAFTDWMGYTRPAAAQLYPTLEGGAESVEGIYLHVVVDSAGRPISRRTTSSPERSVDPTPP